MSSFPFCQAGGGGANRSRTDLANSLTSSLTNSSYIVQPGSSMFFFLKDCDTYNLDTCFALNADTPYGFALVPDGPGQPAYTDCETLTDVCGIGCPPGDPKICVDGKPMKYVLGKDEAIIMLLESPPPCQYWSLTYYQMSTSYANEGELRIRDPSGFSSALQEFGSVCPSNEEIHPGMYPGRCNTFASLGAPINYRELAIEKNRLFNVSIPKTGPVENFSDGFNQPMAIIMTGSKSLSQKVESELQSLCGASLPTFVAPLPTDVLTMGSTGDSVNDKDLFTVMLRTAFPSNGTEMLEFYDQTPITVMRVSSGQQTEESAPASCDDYYCRCDTTFKIRGNGEMETGGEEFTSQELTDGLTKLGDIIEETHKQKGITVQTSPFIQPYFDTGLDCIDQGTMCNGDCPDALYPIAENVYNAEKCRILNPLILPLGIAGGVLMAIFVFIVTKICLRPPRAIIFPCCHSSANESSSSDGVVDSDGSHSSHPIDTRRSHSSHSSHPIDTRRSFRQFAISSTRTYYLVAVICSACGFWVVNGPCLYVYLTRLQCEHYATLFDDPNDFYVVYGINHAMTGASTYSSVNAYHYEMKSGVGAASSQDGYDGSAQVYLGEDSEIAKYLYVTRFSRDCKASGFDEYCLDIASEGAVSIPIDQRILFIGRLYIDPLTGAGPDPNEVIYDNVKHFYKK
jgi:hypothetical protein